MRNLNGSEIDLVDGAGVTEAWDKAVEKAKEIYNDVKDAVKDVVDALQK